MTTPGLPLRQFAALRYLADFGPAPVREVTAALRADRGDVQNALRLLASKGLVTADFDPYPAEYAITDAGRIALAAAVNAAEGGES